MNTVSTARKGGSWLLEDEGASGIFTPEKLSGGDTLRVLLAALQRVLKVTPLNTVTLRRRLAEASMERGRYILES